LAMVAGLHNRLTGQAAASLGVVNDHGNRRATA